MNIIYKTKFDSKLAFITSTEHPFYGSSGICLGAVKLKKGWAFKFEHYKTKDVFYIFDANDICWEDEETLSYYLKNKKINTYLQGEALI